MTNINNKEVDISKANSNSKETVIQNTCKLNEILHKYGISEKLRSQFVGSCLISLKNGLRYSDQDSSAAEILMEADEIFQSLLNNDNTQSKELLCLIRNMFNSSDIQSLNKNELTDILLFIDKSILSCIGNENIFGQDLLNLFFVTFNKYAGKSDKNQAFTPDHISDFMAKAAGVDKNSVILDPCCGSGALLIKAILQSSSISTVEKDQSEITKNHVIGFECDKNVFGLAATNMLLHSDNNAEIYCGNCFDCSKVITESKPTIVLMNPPYNAQRKFMPSVYTETWGKDTKEDPSKGFYFVKFIADTLNSAHIQATIAVLLPVACAIGNSKEITRIKNDLLKENKLDAVFTLPNEIFYPGASVSVCCMIFKVGINHSEELHSDTFFGYYKEDGFRKRKNLGRIEQIDAETGKSKWSDIEAKWLDLYHNRQAVDGLSAVQKVTGDDEWLCEAYMNTDYSTLTEEEFRQTLYDYLSFQVKEGNLSSVIHMVESLKNDQILIGQ